MASPPLACPIAGPYSKTCRLCADRIGPFLNIFGVDMNLATKIKKLLSIEIKEFDDLPHKACFRCSAKVFELSEFADKCFKTQENFTAQFEKDKLKNIKNSWEAQLKEKNMSNDEYCDALVKKAIGSLPLLSKEKSDDKIILKNARIALKKIDEQRNEDGSIILPKDLVNIKVNLDALSNVQSNKTSSDWLKNWNVQQVSNVGKVYTCKHCNNVIVNEQKAKNHSCKISNKSKTVINVSENDDNKKKTNQNSVFNALNNIGNNQFNNAVGGVLVKMPNNGVAFLKFLNKSNLAIDEVLNNIYGDSDQVWNPMSNFNFATTKTGSNSNKVLKPNLSGNAQQNQQKPKRKRVPKPKSMSIDPESVQVILDEGEPLNFDKTSSPYPVGLFSGTSQNQDNSDDSFGHSIFGNNFESPTDDIKSKSKTYKVINGDDDIKMVISSVSKKTESTNKSKRLKSVTSNRSDVKDVRIDKNDQNDSPKQGYFTFVNIDSVSDPSYVLPTAPSLQVSQVTTTDPVDINNSSKKRKISGE